MVKNADSVKAGEVNTCSFSLTCHPLCLSAVTSVQVPCVSVHFSLHTLISPHGLSFTQMTATEYIVLHLAF